eukprot:jgi/Tetstr1/461967/TSEL_007040.t1
MALATVYRPQRPVSRPAPACVWRDPSDRCRGGRRAALAGLRRLGAVHVSSGRPPPADRSDGTCAAALPVGVALTAGAALLALSPLPALAAAGHAVAAAGGGHSGASLGVTALRHVVTVYPIDVVKTRMQAQRNAKHGVRAEGSTSYSSAWDCFATILREEGVGGLYNGLLAQLIGVWPDKAAKLSANEYMLGLLADPALGTVSPLGQIAAGLFAGMCQVVFSNPREIVKIQMQMIGASKERPGAAALTSHPPARQLVLAGSMSESGEVQAGDAELGELSASTGVGGRRMAAPAVLVVESRAGSQAADMLQVLRELGLRGLYRGASVCAARDMTFSAMYFPIYGFLKASLAAHGLSGSGWIMLTGTMAGIPASFCTNPVDIIKTRVQAERARPGEARRTIAEHTQELLDEGGARTLLQGVGPRVMRTALQFGFTLVVYENINEYLHWN